MRRFLRALVIRCALLGSSLLFAFGLLEVALHLFWEPDNPPGFTRKHPARSYQLRAGYSGHTYAAPLEINSLGVRGPEREISFDPDALRIVVLGDSMVYGVGVSNEETFPAVLERLLQERRAGPVQVFNLGVPSYNTEDELLYLIETYDSYRPHLVVLQYMYGNDASLKPRPRPQRGWRRLPGVQALREIPPSSRAFNWLWQRQQRLRFLLQSRSYPTDRRELLRFNTTRMLASDYAADAPGWIKAQEAMGEIVEFCDRRGVHLVVGSYFDDMNLDPESRAILAPAIARVTDAVKARGVVHAIVLDDAFLDYAGREELLWVRPDDVHWSPLGHELIAAFVADYLTEHDELRE